MENKVVIITGATSGIGKVTAIKFSEAGAKVVVSGRREAEGLKVVEAIELAGGEAFFVRADVAKEADMKNLVTKAVEKYGRLDIAFNNAGVEMFKPIGETVESDFEKAFSINVWGVLSAMKHQIPAMLETGGGSIINTTSLAGHVGMAGGAVYVASKHAVEGLTKSVALEYAKAGIRVNAVAPGGVATEMIDRSFGETGSEMREGIISMHPMGRLAFPEEIAAAVLFLASDEASFMTGESIKVDGGFFAQ